MAKKSEEQISLLATTHTYPLYVRLKPVNPYHNKVVCNGITVTTDKKTLIPNQTTMSKLKNIEDYLIIEYVQLPIKKS